VPTYQYACTECGYGFDAVQSFTDDALTECPQCGGRLRKVFGSVGVVFKGSGFYRNDSREAAKAGAKSAGGGEGKSGAAGGEGKSGSGESGSATEKTSQPAGASSGGSSGSSDSSSSSSSGSKSGSSSSAGSAA